MKEDLRTLVLSLVPPSVGQRVYRGNRPQGSPLPSVLLSGISTVVRYTQKGPDNMPESRVQIDCYALTFGEAEAVKAALETGLSGFHGTVGSTDFQGIFLESSDRETSEKDDAQGLIFTQSMDFMINHKET